MSLTSGCVGLEKDSFVPLGALNSLLSMTIDWNSLGYNIAATVICGATAASVKFAHSKAREVREGFSEMQKIKPYIIETTRSIQSIDHRRDFLLGLRLHLDGLRDLRLSFTWKLLFFGVLAILSVAIPYAPAAIAILLASLVGFGYFAYNLIWSDKWVDTVAGAVFEAAKLLIPDNVRPAIEREQ